MKVKRVEMRTWTTEGGRELLREEPLADEYYVAIARASASELAELGDAIADALRPKVAHEPN